MTEDRRRYFRIDDTIGIKTEVVDSRQLDEKLENFWKNQHPYSAVNEFNFELEQHRADLKRIKDKLPEVGRYLEMLQKQIDILTAKVLRDEDNFVELEKKVNLSAQGIAFFSDEAVAAGEIVELHLQLFPEKTKLVIFAKVVDCRRDSEGSDQFKISLDFEHIHEADRELLVRHVHGKQLRALGAARFEEDEA